MRAIKRGARRAAAGTAAERAGAPQRQPHLPLSAPGPARRSSGPGLTCYVDEVKPWQSRGPRGARARGRAALAAIYSYS